MSFLTAALMAVALCVHSVLEGAALGAQREIAKTFHIFVAILAHKASPGTKHHKWVLNRGVSVDSGYGCCQAIAAGSPVILQDFLTWHCRLSNSSATHFITGMVFRASAVPLDADEVCNHVNL